MNRLIISGNIEYEGELKRFSFSKSKLSIYDRISHPKLRGISGPSFDISIIFGSTDTGGSVVFVENKIIDHFGIQYTYPKAVFLSNHLKLNADTKFSSITLIGGTLNNFGDIISDIFISNTENYDNDTLTKGICRFETRSHKDTDVLFTDISDKNSHQYKFSINRQFSLNNYSISKFHQYFIYKVVEGIDLKKSFEKILEMFYFINLLSWEEMIRIEKITLKVKNERNPRFDIECFFNQYACDETKIKLSIMDYISDNNAIGNLYANNIKFRKHHPFVLGEIHKKHDLTSKDVLESVIAFEQIIHYFKINQPKMDINLKKFRNSMIETIPDEDQYKEFKEYLERFKGEVNKLKELITNFIQNNDLLAQTLNKNIFNSENNDKLIKSILKVIDFRNTTVHSSDFDLHKEGLSEGTIILTYVNYYIILTKSEYTAEKAIKILNKLFNFFY